MPPNETPQIQVIFWDFDGVLLNSNTIRDLGFAEVLKAYPAEQVQRLLEFHRRNGGLSRYVKFRYFFETIRGESISEEVVQEWAGRFSQIMRQLLARPELLIRETVEFAKANSSTYTMYIVSGSDQAELRFLCSYLHIDTYFQRIHGSPTPKKEWVNRILQEEGHLREHCILIGDSINDQEAAQSNGIHFMGYNNEELWRESTLTIDFSQRLPQV